MNILKNRSKLLLMDDLDRAKSEYIRLPQLFTRNLSKQNTMSQPQYNNEKLRKVRQERNKINALQDRDRCMFLSSGD